MENQWKIGPESEKFPDPVFASIFGRSGSHLGTENGTQIEENGVRKNMKNDERKNHKKNCKKRST